MCSTRPLPRLLPLLRVPSLIRAIAAQSQLLRLASPGSRNFAHRRWPRQIPKPFASRQALPAPSQFETSTASLLHHEESVHSIGTSLAVTTNVSRRKPNHP